MPETSIVHMHADQTLHFAYQKSDWHYKLPVNHIAHVFRHFPIYLLLIFSSLGTAPPYPLPDHYPLYMGTSCDLIPITIIRAAPYTYWPYYGMKITVSREMVVGGGGYIA